MRVGVFTKTNRIIKEVCETTLQHKRGALYFSLITNPDS